MESASSVERLSSSSGSFTELRGGVGGEDLEHRVERKDVAVHPEPCDEADRGVREDAMDVPRRDVRNMDLHVRKPGTLDAIAQCVARVRETGWIHHQAVDPLIGGLIDPV